jgi:hypothetical protein
MSDGGICPTGSAQFPALTLSDQSFAEVLITAHFKPIAGQADQAVASGQWQERPVEVIGGTPPPWQDRR